MLRLRGLLLPLLLVLFCWLQVAGAQGDEELNEDHLRNLAKELGSDEEVLPEPAAGGESPGPSDVMPESLEELKEELGSDLPPLEEASPGEASQVPPTQEDAAEPPVLEDTNAECPNWASQGMCKENPSFMLKTCPVSCASAEDHPDVTGKEDHPDVFGSDETGSDETCSIEDRQAGLCGVPSSTEAVEETGSLTDKDEEAALHEQEDEAKRAFEELRREGEEDEEKIPDEEAEMPTDQDDEAALHEQERLAAEEAALQEQEQAALEQAALHEKERAALEEAALHQKETEEKPKSGKDVTGLASMMADLLSKKEKKATPNPSDEDHAQKMPALDQQPSTQHVDQRENEEEPPPSTQHINQRDSTQHRNQRDYEEEPPPSTQHINQRDHEEGKHGIDPRVYEKTKQSLEEAELEAERLREDVQVLKQQKSDAKMQEAAATQKAQKAENAKAQAARELEAMRRQIDAAEETRLREVKAAKEEAMVEAKLEADKRVRETEDQLAQEKTKYEQRQKIDAGMKEGIIAVNSVFSNLGAFAYTVAFGAFQKSFAQLAALEPPLNIIVGFFSVFVMFMVSVRGFGKRSVSMPVMAAPTVAMPAASGGGNVDISAALAPLQQQIDGLRRHQDEESTKVARNIQKLEAQLKHFQNECNCVEEEMLMATKEILAWLAPGETPERPVAQAPTTTVNGISLQQSTSRTPTTEVASTNGVTAVASFSEAPCPRAVSSAPVPSITEAAHELATSASEAPSLPSNALTPAAQLDEAVAATTQPVEAPSLPSNAPAPAPQLDEAVTATTQPVEGVTKADDLPFADLMGSSQAPPVVPSSIPPTVQPVEEAPVPPTPTNPPPFDTAPAVSTPPMFEPSPPAFTSSESPPNLNAPPGVSDSPTPLSTTPLADGPPAINGVSEPPTTPSSAPPPTPSSAPPPTAVFSAPPVTGGPPATAPLSSAPPSIGQTALAPPTMGPPLGGSRPKQQEIKAATSAFGVRPAQKAIQAPTSAFGARPVQKAYAAQSNPFAPK